VAPGFAGELDTEFLGRFAAVEIQASSADRFERRCETRSCEPSRAREERAAEHYWW
jgi:hypothetical protein